MNKNFLLSVTNAFHLDFQMKRTNERNVFALKIKIRVYYNLQCVLPVRNLLYSLELFISSYNNRVKHCVCACVCVLETLCEWLFSKSKCRFHGELRNSVRASAPASEPVVWIFPMIFVFRFFCSFNFSPN